jgi:predicted DNA binding protein
MKHVRARITAHGREDEIHPIYGMLVNAPFVERATALQYNFTDEELSMLHYVEGDADALEAAVADIPEAFDFAIDRVDDRRFYAYLRGANTEGIVDMFAPLSESGLVVVPPIVQHEDGTVSLSLVGPQGEFEPVIERAPDARDITIEAVGGLASTGAADARLSERQREAVATGLELGYYEMPREASQADVAEAMGCAPSTAAEHLQKAESVLVRSALGE